MLIVEFMTTEKCNLECTYCYMANKQKFMTRETADLFFENLDVMLDTYNDDKYHISYFGGEPLLNWDIIEYTAPRFKNDPRCHSIVVISNLLELTEKRVEFLKQHNIGVSFSFDGIWSDTNRPYYKDKISSFTKYIEKKDLIKSIAGGCKVMVSPENTKTMTENFEFFVNEYGFNMPDYSLVRDDIWKQEDIEVFDVEIKRLADKVIEYNKKGITCNVGFFQLYMMDVLVARKVGKRKFGCFAGVNGCSYTPDAKFFPCARFASGYEYELYDSRTKVKNLDNINKLKQPKFTDPREFEECKDCRLYKYCNAGCTYSQMKNGNGERAAPISSVCEILKLCYREALRVFEELKYNENYKGSLLNMLNNMG